MRQLKNQQPLADLYFDKHTKNIKLCCHIFFEYVNSKLRAILPDYQNAKIHDSKNGILLCPECIIQKLTSHSSIKVMQD